MTVNVNTISLQSKVEIQIAFYKQNVSAYELRITGPDGTTVIPAAEFDTSIKNYSFIRFAVPAKNMRALYTFALYDPATGEAVTSVYTCSVESYARGSIDKGNYVEALKAMMKYGDSVSLI